MYYGRVEEISTQAPGAYCHEGIRACLQCPGNKVKTVSGNSESLCVDNDCDGTKTVLNSDRSGCGKCSLIMGNLSSLLEVTFSVSHQGLSLGSG